ncbi:hypothetical protein TTHERM_00476920 (macronuclear) [Tetrahymena thermophila SB210]|uniref:Uncharacterized protein n=1 Tax=Tetrahymena thermophila (strain SB210) TaxID=312017 RepID=I7LV40_TETTS|nr:hypothetical protein TTHERM_00476920 [Tetrahymena thermophila SB210]EAR97154.2 hypothetical protein TTHERM_00476920 [Tetrahymena thermophila SB210]|eukprot:XP_001017399.2 hypothetical protein TTHERM_00476920 [Tetrahymena thermophila SB210]
MFNYFYCHLIIIKKRFKNELSLMKNKIKNKLKNIQKELIKITKYLNKQLMFLSHTSRYNPFEEFNRAFNSFWDEDFSDYFSTMRTPFNIFDRKISKEEQLRRRLNSLHNQENEINHYIKQYESQIEQLKKNRDQVEKKRNEITDQIARIAEENKKIQENKQNIAAQNSEKFDSSDQLKSENRVFKRVHYISDGMEIEEQYDSTNPKNCYKIIRKQGEIPQVISNQSNPQIEQNKAEQKVQSQQTQSQEEIPTEKLGDGLDEKLEQLSKITGKSQKDLRNFMLENKELTLGQLYDKLNEQKQS